MAVVAEQGPQQIGRSGRIEILLRAMPYLAVVVASWPLLAGGYPRGHDWSLELVRVVEYGVALQEGQVPPYWASNLYGGYGSPIFLFYPPLFLFFSSLVGMVLAMHQAVPLVLITLAVISVWATQKMLESAQPESGGAAGRVAAYVYVLHPYLLGDKLIRNANAEFAGLCLAPLALAGVFMLSRHPRKAMLLLAGGLGLIIVAHNLTALVMMGLVLAGGGVQFAATRKVQGAFACMTGIGLALLLTMFYWLPALALRSWMRPDQLLEGPFDFHQNFHGLHWVFGYGQFCSIMRLELVEPFFSTGLLTPILLGLALTAAFAYRRGGVGARWLLSALAGVLGLVFLLTPASTRVWEGIPLMAYFQFPWRLVGPLALLTALAAGLGFAMWQRGRGLKLQVASELAIFVLCVANAVPLLAQYQPLPPEFVARLPEVVEPDAIRTQYRKATVREEYLPPWAAVDAWKQRRPVKGPVVEAVPPADVAVSINWGSVIALRVLAEAPTRLRIARWITPDWRAQVNGVEVQVRADPFGSFDVEVPGGQSDVRLWLEPPPIRRASVWISVLAVVGGAGWWLRYECGAGGEEGRPGNSHRDT